VRPSVGALVAATCRGLWTGECLPVTALQICERGICFVLARISKDSPKEQGTILISNLMTKTFFLTIFLTLSCAVAYSQTTPTQTAAPRPTPSPQVQQREPTSFELSDMESLSRLTRV